MGRALVAPVQRRRRSGELKSPGSRDLTPTPSLRGRWSHAKQAAEKSPGGEFIL
jgi:hypothetical protein